MNRTRPPSGRVAGGRSGPVVTERRAGRRGRPRADRSPLGCQRVASEGRRAAGQLARDWVTAVRRHRRRLVTVGSVSPA